MTDQNAAAAGAAKSAEVPRPPFPPFTRESAILKVRGAEDGWNTRAPEKVCLAYTVDSKWRNRSEFINGRQEIIAFLKVVPTWDTLRSDARFQNLLHRAGLN